jgi:hypothetical protein
MDLRHQRCTHRRIAKAVGAPLTTVGRDMKSLGLGGCATSSPRLRCSDTSGGSRAT